jgi:hypothetical protein
MTPLCRAEHENARTTQIHATAPTARVSLVWDPRLTVLQAAFPVVFLVERRLWATPKTVVLQGLSSSGLPRRFAVSTDRFGCAGEDAGDDVVSALVLGTGVG